eukprot:1057851-Pyramimonas_sp.AAC.1
MSRGLGSMDGTPGKQIKGTFVPNGLRTAVLPTDGTQPSFMHQSRIELGAYAPSAAQEIQRIADNGKSRARFRVEAKRQKNIGEPVAAMLRELLTNPWSQ